MGFCLSIFYGNFGLYASIPFRYAASPFPYSCLFLGPGGLLKSFQVSVSLHAWREV